MTAYSFGNKWMGIIALKDPPSAVPEPLHKMALRLRQQAQAKSVKLDGDVEISVTKTLGLLGRIRHRNVLREQWSIVRECQDAESKLRAGADILVRRGLRRELLQEMRIRERRNQARPPAPVNGVPIARRIAADPVQSQTPRNIATNWTAAVPLAPSHPALPALSKRLSAWLHGMNFNLDDNAKTWLRWASMHSSYHYESAECQRLVGAEALHMLEQLGLAWLKVGIMENIRSSHGEFESSAEVSLAFQGVTQVISELGTLMAALECARLGQSELVAAAMGEKSRALEKVGVQIVGALCLIFGSYTPAKTIIEQLSTTIVRPLDWKTLLHTALKREPQYSEVRRGPDHAAEFTSTVSDGHRSAKGWGSSRKEAQREAAKLFVSNYLPNFAIQQKKRKIVAAPQLYGTSTHAHAQSVTLIGAMFEVSPLALISQSLTHSSWAHENKPAVCVAKQRDYGVLAAEGSALVPAVVYHEHVVTTLGRSLRPAKDLARMPAIHEEAMENLSDELRVQHGILLSHGTKLNARIKSDAAQAVVAAAWRASPGRLTGFQPPAMRAWVKALGNELDAATQLEGYCAAIKLQSEVSYDRCGVDHANEYRATYMFNIADRPIWQGPWRTNKTKAKKSAAAEIVELLIAQGDELSTSMEPREESLLAAFFMAEIGAADIAAPIPSHEVAVRRLGVDSLASGSLFAFAAWALGRERFAPSGGAVVTHLQRYYTKVLIQHRRNDLASWVRKNPRLVTLPEKDNVATGIPATFHVEGAQRLSLLSKLLTKIPDKDCSLDSVLTGWLDTRQAAHTIDSGIISEFSAIPGAGPATAFLLELAVEIAERVDTAMEVALHGEGKSAVELAIRIQGVDVATSLQVALSCATAVVPGISWSSTENSVLLIIPIIPEAQGEIARAGFSALERALEDPWLAEFRGALDVLTERSDAIIGALDAMDIEQDALKGFLALRQVADTHSH